MASEPRPPGSYLWNTAKDMGAAFSQEASKAAADIGSTAQAVIFGWNTQAAHNAAARDASHWDPRILEETAIAETAKTIEPPPEISKDGPAKE